MKPIAITGVWLMRTGGENDANAHVEVHVETAEGWRMVITEPLGANFSHSVSADGIRESPMTIWNDHRATCSRGAKIGEGIGIVP